MSNISITQEAVNEIFERVKILIATYGSSSPKVAMVIRSYRRFAELQSTVRYNLLLASVQSAESVYLNEQRSPQQVNDDSDDPDDLDPFDAEGERE